MPKRPLQGAQDSSSRAIGLAYGHVASNVGDLAINAGISNLVAQSNSIRITQVVGLDLNEKFRSAAERSFIDLSRPFIELPPPDKIDTGLARLELLATYLADPALFITDAGLSSTNLILLNSGEHLFESKNQSHVESLIWRILPLVAAVATGRSAVQMPSTFGPFRTALGTTVANMIARYTAGWAARESASRRYMERLLNIPRVPELLDPAFFIPSHNQTLMTGRPRKMALVVRLEDYGLRAGSRRSSFLAAKHNGSNFRESQAFRTFMAIAVGHIESGGTITVIVQTDADRAISEALVSAIETSTSAQAVSLADPSDLGRYTALVADQDFVVASRFHACIIAMTQGVPALGVFTPSHGPKMPGLFELIGRPGDAVLLGERHPDIVASEVIDKIQGAARSNELSQEVIDQLRVRTRTWFEASLEGAPREEPMLEERILLLASLVRESERISNKKIVKNMA